jgi:putative phage-type endonuclease
MSNLVEQGSQEWLNERLGHVTGSRVSDALAKKGTATRENYLWQLVAERLTGQVQESFSPNAAMIRGTEQEPIARAAYEANTGHFVAQTGFVKHPTLEWFGASPDGLVGDDGLVEIKNPNSATHLAYRKAGQPPAKYRYQMMAQMACTGRQWCDFVSYDSRLPENKQLFIVRFTPEPKDMEAMLTSIQEFLDEVKKECE